MPIMCRGADPLWSSLHALLNTSGRSARATLLPFHAFTAGDVAEASGVEITAVTFVKMINASR